MIHTDVLIIGSGVAALQLAKKLSYDSNVIVLTKSYVRQGNSNLAQGGIAAALADEDHPTNHYKDTIEAGRFTNNHELVKEMTNDAPDLIRELLREGCNLDRNDNGELFLGLEGAHSHHRIVHGGGDATGQKVMDFLVEKTKHIQIIEHMTVIDLLISDDKCIGVKAKNTEGEVKSFFANHIVLATGGLGGLYSFTSNENTVTGDGIALAYRAGAEVCDMEFIQFHPTLLFVNGQCKGLVSEAVRGAGASLVIRDGTRIMKGIHPMEDLAPRHIVSQTIYDHLQTGKQVYLDIRRIVEFQKKFPTITAMCHENHIDISHGMIPVVPGCHFLMGGVKTDHFGRTSINGLYAIGEVAYTGMHGANRLASNSLLEGLFFGKRLAEYIHSKKEEGVRIQGFPLPMARNSTNERLILPDIEMVQRKMMNDAGIVRNGRQLKRHLAWLESFRIQKLLTCSLDDKTEQEIQVIFMLITAWLVTQSALLREESRGGHYRADFPYEEESWLTKKVILKQQSTQGEYYEQIKAAYAT